MILDRKTIKELAKHLGKYKIYIDERLEREVEIINNSSNDVNSSIRSKNKVSRTTEEIAIILATDSRLAWLKAMITAIEDLRISLLEEPILLKILECKYLNKTRSVSDISVIMEISANGYPLNKDLYYKYKEKILYRFEKILYKSGMLS